MHVFFLVKPTSANDATDRDSHNVPRSFVGWAFIHVWISMILVLSGEFAVIQVPSTSSHAS